MSLQQIEAVIFDMDGVLIDTEPAWQQAEVDLLPEYGIPITYEDTFKTTGLRIDQVIDYWYQRYPWPDYDNAEVSRTLVQAVIAFIHRDGKPMTGVTGALEYCQQQGYSIGLATSSPMKLVDAVLDRLNIRHYFQAIASAKNLQYGKPHPEVYLNCAKSLNIHPVKCLAIEDSFNGVIAARAANMQTVVIPPPEQQQQARWVVAHYQLADLSMLANMFTG
ncbi:hexitol phosphatase HxpB [Spongorhabdus nitratireducens]